MVASPITSHDAPVASEDPPRQAGAAAQALPGVQDLVRALGGTQAVAKACGVVPTAVSMWMTSQKVPARHHATVWRLAQARGVAWTPPGFEGFRLLPADAPHAGDLNVTFSQSDRENIVKAADAA